MAGFQMVIESYLPYTRHYNPLLIWIRSWFESALDYKPRILGSKIEEFLFIT